MNTFWPTKNIDLIITYSIIATFAEANKGILALTQNNQWDGAKQYHHPLPKWMDALIIALKKIHGEDYYAFALDNVTNELITTWVEQGMSQDSANQFMLTVRRSMQSPHSLLH